MYKYGQYCPISKAVEIVGDRWTLLIVRDLLTGTCHFNDLAHGLPGISRGLLAERLRRLQAAGIVNKVERNGRQRTSYQLTQAGIELQPIIESLLFWGTTWAFNEPEPADLDPLLLLWWMRNGVHMDRLPEQRVVIQFDFQGTVAERYWLLLTKEDVSVCLTYPGFEPDVFVTADIATFFQVWLGRLDFVEAAAAELIQIDAIPGLENAFPDWFTYSLAAPAVRAVASR